MSIDPKSGFCAANSIFYSKRTPISLPSDRCLDITTFISSGKHSGKVALIDATTDRKITYPELWSNVESLATSLSDMGIRKGHVVLLLSPNSVFFPIICLAVLSLGAIITTTNPLNTSGEITKQIEDSKPILVFTITALLPKITSNLPIVLIDNCGSEQKNATVVSRLEIMLQTKPNQNRVGGIISQEDTATLLYSSGTTGLSKGVASSHRNLIAMASIIMKRFQYDDDYNPDHIFICTVPMFHVYGLAAFACGLLGLGSTIVILSKFELDEMLFSIERYRATYLPLVPPILIAMINHAKTIKKRYDLSSLKRVLSGGAPLSKEVIEGFILAYPTVTILQGYGLTETCGMGASTDSMEESRRYGTAGLLSPNMEGKIVDPDSGKSLPVNRTGELWLRGPSVMKGYFSNPEATSLTLDSDGWLRTGDLCYFDEDGFIFVVDRLKELIKYKGYQVAPAELEALLISHPQIEDAAVIPFPDKDVGQYPFGYVVRKAGNHLSPGEVMEFIAKQVSPYKRIRRVEFVSSIPKSASGKILRKDLISIATSKL